MKINIGMKGGSSESDLSFDSHSPPKLKQFFPILGPFGCILPSNRGSKTVVTSNKPYLNWKMDKLRLDGASQHKDQ
jgi:hypothetical protein